MLQLTHRVSSLIPILILVRVKVVTTVSWLWVFREWLQLMHFETGGVNIRRSPHFRDSSWIPFSSTLLAVLIKNVLKIKNRCQTYFANLPIARPVHHILTSIVGEEAVAIHTSQLTFRKTIWSCKKSDCHNESLIIFLYLPYVCFYPWYRPTNRDFLYLSLHLEILSKFLKQTLCFLWSSLKHQKSSLTNLWQLSSTC